MITSLQTVPLVAGTQRSRVGDRPETPQSRLALSVREAVALSGLSRSYLYEAMAKGQLPFVKKGRRRLILATVLADYIMRNDE